MSNPNSNLLASDKPNTNNLFRVNLILNTEKDYFIDNLQLKMIELSLLESSRAEAVYAYKETLTEMAISEHSLYALFLLSKLTMTN